MAIDSNLIHKYDLEIIPIVDCIKKDRQKMFKTYPMLWLKHGSLKFLSKRGFMNLNTKMSVNFMYNILTIWQHFWWGIIYIRLQFNFFNWRKEFYMTTLKYSMTGCFLTVSDCWWWHFVVIWRCHFSQPCPYIDIMILILYNIYLNLSGTPTWRVLQCWTWEYFALQIVSGIR